jgi:galactonate dehydratase
MKCRGFFGGFYHDAIAALDIALWDAKGKLLGRPVYNLLGGARALKVPCYVSGLPRPNLADRVTLAGTWKAKGFNAFKFAAAISHEGIIEEMRALREGLGPEVKILVDLHWKFTPGRAIKLISELERYDLFVAEAPVRPEDIAGLARVARSVRTPVAVGEELRTVHEFRQRFEACAMDIIQPEMGRTGITSFWQIGQLARAWNCEVMPHASIGIGIFQAASLHASAALDGLSMHEYQHSIFDRYLHLVTGDMRCADGFFHLPSGPGLGVEPRPEALALSCQT